MKLSELKVGDRFSCEFTVLSLNGKWIGTRRGASPKNNVFDSSDEETEVTLLPPKIKVGDFVRALHHPERYFREVLAVKEGLCVLWYPETKSSYTAQLDQLVICNQEGTSK